MDQGEAQKPEKHIRNIYPPTQLLFGRDTTPEEWSGQRVPARANPGPGVSSEALPADLLRAGRGSVTPHHHHVLNPPKNFFGLH